MRIVIQGAGLACLLTGGYPGADVGGDDDGSDDDAAAPAPSIAVCMRVKQLLVWSQSVQTLCQRINFLID